jgi:hypothetical protein
LAPEHGDLVAQDQQLDLVGVLRACEEQHKLEHAAKSDIDESL